MVLWPETSHSRRICARNFVVGYVDPVEAATVGFVDALPEERAGVPGESFSAEGEPDVVSRGREGGAAFDTVFNTVKG